MAFYRTIFRQSNGDSALKAMNDALDPNHETFWTISAEAAFKIVYRSHLQEHGTPEGIERRVERIVSNLGTRRRAAGTGTIQLRD
jgi:hypothetical protein